ncbi:MAG: DEAD/DEAH box helicase, partial [Vagococcus sp.]|nr:DEAD/DEAH box helicase [Vagococcus sp.]
LADDMGLGKTVQTITYLLSEKEEGKLTSPSLIVAPASLLYNWQIEIEKFAPSLKVAVVIGSKLEREEIVETHKDVDVLVTSYATLRQDFDIYNEQTFHSLILDEAQMIKNAATKTFQTIETLKADHYFALSGTPIENKLEELWSLFRILMPGFFPPLRRFKQLPTESIAMMIQPFVLRREKKQVLKDLPDKIETDLYSHLTEEQKTVYVAHLRQMQKSLSVMSKKELNQNRISILAGLTRLRQICCHPKLFIEDYEGDSGKLIQALDIIQTAKSNGRRILLFSQFTGMLDILEEELAKKEISTFYLRGSTPISKRQEMVDRFNRGDKDVFLISLKAGGTGLNLTGADTVILYDLWWNPAVEDQATGRAHRMGQKKKVEVWRLISEGTVEEKMNRLQAEKKELFQQVLNSEDVKELSKMTIEDIQDILDVGI